jgi:hypothetical protein
MSKRMLGLLRAGDGLAENRLDFVQHDAITAAHRKGSLAKVTFPAGAFDEVADFEIVAAFEPSLGCERFHVMSDPFAWNSVVVSKATSYYLYHNDDRISRPRPAWKAD